jgi:hypothetical protein
MRKAGETMPMIGTLMSGSPAPKVRCRHDFDRQGE